MQMRYNVIDSNNSSLDYTIVKLYRHQFISSRKMFWLAIATNMFAAAFATSVLLIGYNHRLPVLKKSLVNSTLQALQCHQ